MAKAKRPRFRVNDRVTLAEHTPLIPAYGGKPFVGRETILRVSSVAGKGTLRDPWAVNITDDAGHFWHMQPDDLVLAKTSAPAWHHATKKKSPAQLDREIKAALKLEAMKRGETVVTNDEEMDQIEALVVDAGIKNFRSLPNPQRVGIRDQYIAWIGPSRS